MNTKTETIRVSTALLALLEDPSSMPKTQTYCSLCRMPKVDPRQRVRCEICGEYGTVTGIPLITANVYFEEVPDDEPAAACGTDRPRARIFRRTRNGSVTYFRSRLGDDALPE